MLEALSWEHRSLPPVPDEAGTVGWHGGLARWASTVGSGWVALRTAGEPPCRSHQSPMRGCGTAASLGHRCGPCGCQRQVEVVKNGAVRERYRWTQELPEVTVSVEQHVEAPQRL